MESISDRIFSLMKQKEIPIVQLAKYLNVTHTVVSSWNTRGTIPKAVHLIKICECLGVSMEYLLTGQEGTSSIVFPKKELNEEEQIILSLYRKLDRESQIELRGELKGRIAASQPTSESERVAL